MKPKNETVIEVIPANPEMVRKENESEHKRTIIRSELFDLNQKQMELIHNLNLLGKEQSILTKENKGLIKYLKAVFRLSEQRLICSRQF